MKVSAPMSYSNIQMTHRYRAGPSYTNQLQVRLMATHVLKLVLRTYTRTVLMVSPSPCLVICQMGAIQQEITTIQKVFKLVNLLKVRLSIHHGKALQTTLIGIVLSNLMVAPPSSVVQWLSTRKLTQVNELDAESFFLDAHLAEMEIVSLRIQKKKSI